MPGAGVGQRRASGGRSPWRRSTRRWARRTPRCADLRLRASFRPPCSAALPVPAVMPAHCQKRIDALVAARAIDDQQVSTRRRCGYAPPHSGVSARLIGAIVEVVQQLYQEAVEVHAAELLAHHGGGQVVGRQAWPWPLHARRWRSPAPCRCGAAAARRGSCRCRAKSVRARISLGSVGQPIRRSRPKRDALDHVTWALRHRGRARPRAPRRRTSRLPSLPLRERVDLGRRCAASVPNLPSTMAENRRIGQVLEDQGSSRSK